MNNHITPPINCTGCGLCANVCSKDAIQMVWSEDGFLVPEVDTAACINCGMCVRQCIALEENPQHTDDCSNVISYGGWNNDKETHLKSSSGGIFSALAENIITQGGVVFGVVWQDKLTAIFSQTDTLDGVEYMRGSKYTPALPGNVYRNVKTELSKGRNVLFSGTPCQVHALKKYLRKEYENLLTVDIMCHGVPSHNILERYVEENEARVGKKIHHISFRDKSKGWLHYHVAKYYTDGSAISDSNGSDIYMRLFLCDKALNYCCYNCPYAHIPRQGDITLGDYWGVQNHHDDWPIDKGISSILANSKKGTAALEHISDKISLMCEPFQKIYNGQRIVYIRPQSQIPSARAKVLQELRYRPLTEIYRKTVNIATFGPFNISKSNKLYRLLNAIRNRLKKALHHLKIKS